MPLFPKLKDRLSILACFTPAKSWNAAKVAYSYNLSKRKRRPVHLGLPISVSIEPTTSCNLRCPQCPSGLREFTRDTGMLKDDFFKAIIDELSPHLAYLTFYFQGEPYLNPRFLEMVKYASSKRIYTATSTNAHFLNDENARKTVESGLNRLIISIDGVTQESYSTYRIGGILDKVLSGAENIVKWKKKLNSSTPYTIFQFLVTSQNEHQIPAIKELGKKMGIDEVRLKTLQVYVYEEGNALLPKDEHFSRYRKIKDGTYAINNKLLDHCWRSWQSCVITWDGNVVPCCFDKDAKHTLGNIKEQSFKTLWNSKPYNDFRQALLRSRKEIDICTNCTEGTKVWG
jgi:radical SAM protein with 4Fe4S-binding SPASM domain